MGGGVFFFAALVEVKNESVLLAFSPSEARFICALSYDSNALAICFGKSCIFGFGWCLRCVEDAGKYLASSY